MSTFESQPCVCKAIVTVLCDTTGVFHIYFLLRGATQHAEYCFPLWKEHVWGPVCKKRPIISWKNLWFFKKTVTGHTLSTQWQFLRKMAEKCFNTPSPLMVTQKFGQDKQVQKHICHFCGGLQMTCMWCLYMDGEKCMEGNYVENQRDAKTWVQGT
jgi:hypothetical protein